MKEKRTALKKGTVLELNGTKFLITGEAERDTAGITYSAEYVGSTQRVMIKECFPEYDGIYRKDDGALEVTEAAAPEFNNALLKFRNASERNWAVRNTPGLVNSTREMELYYAWETAYAVMSCTDGCDYGCAVDEDAMSVLVRTLALSVLLKKYHENGYLHLNIRPENIFVIPETKEHIMLSGSEAVLSLEELKECGSEQLSASSGYSAPEITNGLISETDARADFYSIGAVAWTKLAESSPRAIGESDGIDLSASRLLCDERLQPAFFRELEYFFRHTLAESADDRFCSDDELIQCLEKLVKLSDIEKVWLISNFSYDYSGFVGRESELNKISEILSDNPVVFLYGIGGIGKTELARRFAKLNAENFRHILFCYYEGSISNTVCSIDIPGVEKDPEESDHDHFKRKLRLLRSLVSRDDLIILDNYDAIDDDLSCLLECDCRFIITTRIDQTQFGCKQLYVDCFDDINDAVTLFRNSCTTEYDTTEQKALCDMIEFLERHTMTIALVAKYLANSKELPSSFLSRLCRKEGITSPADVDVRQRKDHKMRKARIDQHLASLFDISGFSEPERELIGSLSLLGSVRIRKEIFLSRFCGFDENEAVLDRLVHSGWIRLDNSTEKISLHQVILDLVYNFLHPTAENCPHITAAMTEQAIEDIDNILDRRKRDQVVGEFVERVTGDSSLYARLLLNYSNILSNAYSSHKEAKEKCLSEAEQCCDDTPAGKQVLKEICIFRIRQIDPDDTILIMYLMNTTAR